MRRRIYIITGVCSLLVGSIFYLAFRPLSLTMFHWTDAMGLTSGVLFFRKTFSPLFGTLPSWAIYSAPFALYVLSYMLLIQATWLPKTSRGQSLWFWWIPLVSFVAELGQLIEVTPGTFDWIDLSVLTIVVLLGFVITVIPHQFSGGQYYDRKC